MATKDEEDARKRRREREDEVESEELLTRKNKMGQPAKPDGGGGTEKLVELMDRAEPMMEQLNNLYSMYIAGVEQRAPLERRQALDQLMATLMVMAKPTASYSFRFSTLNQKYMSHVDRWTRLLKDLENGKIKRVTGPKRGQ